MLKWPKSKCVLFKQGQVSFLASLLAAVEADTLQFVHFDCTT